MKRLDRHGGNIHAAKRSARKQQQDIMDYSASINPLGASPKIIQALKRQASDVIHYPDPDSYDLCRAIARRYRVSRSQVLVGNGSNELIYHLPQALGITHALVIGPTFSEYARAVTLYGGKVTWIHAKASQQFIPPIEDVVRTLRGKTYRKKGLGDPGALFLCNPNSPTGQLLNQDQIDYIVQQASRKKIRVVLDEAFIDYCENNSMIPMVRHYENLLILRSFTKFYALPGLRLGVLVASPRVVDQVRAVLPTWSVNVLAQAAGLAALEDENFVSRSLNVIRRERTFMTQQLQSLKGCHVYPSAANFLMLRLPITCRAIVMTDSLRKNGILVRDLSAVPGLSSRMIRIGIRTRKDNIRVLNQLGRLLKSRTS